MKAFLNRLLGRRPPPAPETTLGTIPGHLWDVARRRWVPDAESFRPRARPVASNTPDYALMGPVMTRVPGSLS